MEERMMKNSYITAVLKYMNDEVGKGIYEKRLPTRMLYAIRRSLPELDNAYKAYVESLTDICNRYGTTPNHPTCDDEDMQKQMLDEIKELMDMESVVRVYSVPVELLDKCGEGNYDSLTFAEIDRLWWLFEEQ